MPVEIRELVIKTEIRSETHNPQTGASKGDLDNLRNQLLREIKRVAKKQKSQGRFSR